MAERGKNAKAEALGWKNKAVVVWNGGSSLHVQLGSSLPALVAASPLALNGASVLSRTRN